MSTFMTGRNPKPECVDVALVFNKPSKGKALTERKTELSSCFLLDAAQSVYLALNRVDRL